jgi:L-threonylcarbamoyladenylate synthase
MEVISNNDLHRAAVGLAAGELVVVPTRRWYMVCANAKDNAACGRIFRAKRRPVSKPLALVAPSFDIANELFVFSEQARKLADEFWPGDFAMVLPWRDEELGDQHNSVGSPHALVVQEEGILGALARSSPVLLAATTVNLAGHGNELQPGPAITMLEVRRFVDSSGLDIAFGIDGGVCPSANHLTIVDCAGTSARIARQGLVHERAINTVLTAT